MYNYLSPSDCHHFINKTNTAANSALPLDNNLEERVIHPYDAPSLLGPQHGYVPKNVHITTVQKEGVGDPFTPLTDGKTLYFRLHRYPT